MFNDANGRIGYVFPRRSSLYLRKGDEQENVNTRVFLLFLLIWVCFIRNIVLEMWLYISLCIRSSLSHFRLPLPSSLRRSSSLDLWFSGSFVRRWSLAFASIIGSHLVASRRTSFRVLQICDWYSRTFLTEAYHVFNKKCLVTRRFQNLSFLNEGQCYS